MKLEQFSICLGNRQIIHPISLEIEKGEIFVLMGPSGSGKTTLLKGIAGLVPIESGMVNLGSDNDRVGIVFQEPRLFPHMNVIDNLSFGLRAKGYSKKDRYHIVRKYLEILQLDGLEARLPHELSGGQRQRVSLGRTIVLKPDILLLDEPFSSLDAPLRDELTEWLYRLQKKQGFSILWVTHFLDEAFSVADRIGVIINGEMKQVGRPVDVYRNPNSEEIASFFSLPNRFPSKTWRELFCDGLNIEMNEMGWIYSDGLILTVENKPMKSDSTIGWFEGKVQRIKLEPSGQRIIVERNNESWEIFLDIWGSGPHLNDNVMVGVPFNKIIWYPK